MKINKLLMISLLCLMLAGFDQISFAAESSLLGSNSNIIVDGDIIKLDLTKQPKMINSSISKVKAKKSNDGQGYKVHLELHLDKNENIKNLRVIEYNKKTNEFTVETGILESNDIKSEGNFLRSDSYASVTYKSWSWDPAGIVLNWIWTNLDWHYNDSNITSYDGSYDDYAYHGITNWYLSSPVQFSKSGNPSWCQADADASYVNYDFMDDDLSTYVIYDDNKALGYPDGSADGQCDISVSGEYYWLLGYNSLLQRN